MDGQSTGRSWLPDALPQLTGWRWWAFLAVWSLTLAITLLGTATVVPQAYRAATAPASAIAAAGLRLQDYAPGLTLGPPIGREAVQSGLRSGDRLLAIDGEPAGPIREALERQLAGRTGSTLVVTVQDTNGVKSDHRLTRDPAHYREALAAAGLTPLLFHLLRITPDLLSALLFTICALILMVRRRHDPLAPWASLTMLWMVIANGHVDSWFVSHFADPTLAGYVANAIAYSLLPCVLAVFPTGRFAPRWSLLVAILGTLITVATQPLPLAQANLGLLAVLGAAVAAIAARYRAMAPGAGRQQIRWVLLGFAASVVALGLLIVLQAARSRATSFTPYAWTVIGTNVAGSLVSVLLALGITVGLLRYRLYDAETAISRSVVYGALTLSLLAIFAGSEKVIEVLGERYFGEGLGALAGGLGAAVAAVMIAPIHHRVSHWAEHRFRSGLAHLRHGLPLLVGDLRETASPRALADAMLARVERGVRARYGAVVVGGEIVGARDIEPAAVRAWLAQTTLPAVSRDALHCDRADPLLPMRVPLQADGAGLVGWLLLGPRPDGSFFGREDRAALRDIADPVARALAIATAREQRETGRDREIAGLRDLVTRLQQRLDGATARHATA